MSANNFIKIKRISSTWEVSEMDIEGGAGMDLGVFLSLEDAIDTANEYMAENYVEYGLKVDL
jgi:hypothetical protein